MEVRELAGAIEAVLFVAGDPLTRRELAKALDVHMHDLNAAIEQLEMETAQRGVRVVSFGESVQLATNPSFARAIDAAFAAAPRPPLTQSAIEALSVIAYRQPVTRGDIEAVRGVKSDYTVATLLRRGLITEAGRRDTLGRPMQYVTTDLFLRHFGLTDISELPPLPDEEAAPLLIEPRTETDRVAEA